MSDPISRQEAINALEAKIEMANSRLGDAFAIGDMEWKSNVKTIREQIEDDVNTLKQLPSAQPEEVIPHRNYKYLSDYWCECGWHLGKKGEVNYCSDCGRKVNWDG